MKVEIEESIDSKTGETIRKVRLIEEFKARIDKVLVTHQNLMNQYIQVGQQYGNILAAFMDTRNKIIFSDTELKKELNFICRKMRLSEFEPWSYNLAEKCLEMRRPPNLDALNLVPQTASQVMAQNEVKMPGAKVGNITV